MIKYGTVFGSEVEDKTWWMRILGILWLGTGTLPFTLPQLCWRQGVRVSQREELESWSTAGVDHSDVQDLKRGRN